MNSIISRVAASSSLSQQFCRAFASETALSRADFVEKAKEVASPDFAPNEPTTVFDAQAFLGDLRSTSALSVGDGIKNHTAKWLQKELAGNTTSPIEYIMAPEPIKVHGLVVASSYGVDDPALGCPVEYISLKGTSKEHPAVCKYTGNKYYSDWKEGGHH